MKFSEGDKLAQDPLSGCVVVRQHVQHMWLSPRYLNGKIRSGVKELLENQIGKYKESLDGIHLAYSNVKVIQRTSFLLYDSVDMHFDVHYDVVIFRVCPGTLLKCTVNQVSTDHLGCLIHKVINMSVPTAAWPFDPSQVKGEEIICKVTKVEYKKGVVGIFGKLTDDSLTSLQKKFAVSEKTKHGESEMIDSQNNNSIDLSARIKEKKGKKRKKKVMEDIEHQELESFSNSSQIQDDSLFTSSLRFEEASDNHNSDKHSVDRDCVNIKVKKRKKRKEKANEIEKEDGGELVNPVEDDLLSENVKKKKKKRKRDRENVDEDFEDFNDSGINGSLSDGQLDTEGTLHNESLNGSHKRHKKKCKKKKMSDG